MIKRIIFAILCLTSWQISEAQVKWLPFQDAVKQNEAKPKKVFIDVYTDWCGWCKVMDNKTFSQEKVSTIMNKYFYSVKLNAESKDKYTLLGHTFEYEPANKANQLAVALLQGQMSFPSIAFLDETNHLITAVPGYQKPEDIIPMLVFFGEDKYKTVSFEEFKRTFVMP